MTRNGTDAGLRDPIFPRSVTFTADTVGVFEFVGTATDAAGLTGQATITVTVGNPAIPNQPSTSDPGLPPHPGFDPADNTPPTVTITSPEPGASATNLVPIIGTVDDPEDNLWYYRAYYGRLDRIDISSLDLSDPDWTAFHTSTEEVIDGELAVFDPSNVENGPYAVAVAAFDVNGRGSIQSTIVSVEGNVQVGNFRLDFTDLSIPLAGIPIEVTRVYDTVNAPDEGDFGFGWKLGVQDASDPGNDSRRIRVRSR